MKLSAKAIKEFQEAYKKDFGEDIGETQAEEYATRLLNFFSIFIKSDKK